MAATVPGAATIGITHEKKEGFKKVLGIMPEQNDQELYAIFRADSLNRFYVPAVMMGHEEPAPPSSRTVHILGSDSRSKFLSHSLYGVYDSIQAINSGNESPFHQKNDYRNVSGNTRKQRHRSSRSQHWIDGNAGIAQSKGVEKDANDGHISNLVVAGPPSHTVKLLEQVKHRVDDRTAICLMQDGLGIAEAANNEVFTNPDARPSIVLGHMSHALAMDRRRDAVRSQDPNFETALTSVRPYLGRERRDHHHQLDASSEKWLRTQGMLSKFAAASDLRARGLPLDSWLTLKIPSLMFSSVVDPICVLLDCRYEQLLYNPTANRLIGQLLDEIANVVERMPELGRASPALQAALRGEGMRKSTIGRLRGKKGSPSQMVTQIERGQLTDIDYLNGYFIQRGKRLGVDMPANEMVVGMVKAKHKAQLQKLRSYIPMEMTSRL
ncbi:hypothetical protein ACHAQH_004482 [Verticillium albo-atrum]